MLLHGKERQKNVRFYMKENFHTVSHQYNARTVFIKIKIMIALFIDFFFFNKTDIQLYNGSQQFLCV